MENDHHHFPELRMAFSNWLFCVTKSPKPKDEDVYSDIRQKKQRFHTFEKLEPANFGQIWLEKGHQTSLNLW